MTTTYENSWTVDGSRDDVWAVLHPQKDFDRSLTTVDRPRVIEHGSTRVEVLHEGDENGLGLVRRCRFLAPGYLGGTAQSWEMVSEVRAPEFQRYDVLVCAPPSATVKGWYRLEAIEESRTRVHIHEEYTMRSRWLAPLLERRVHDFFLKDNDVKFKGMIEDGLRARRSAA
ncbi:hypothetical protein [uncultured Sphingomonas sp.]|uniref:hypothetical protein n=1 Tax=uncultured Sphingomonas sp. TaxID=158754 RepID=UPI0035CA6741